MKNTKNGITINSNRGIHKGENTHIQSQLITPDVFNKTKIIVNGKDNGISKNFISKNERIILIGGLVTIKLL
jgi:hypothetical protein